MNQNALFNRGLNNENVYGNQQRKMKRNRYYQLKVLKGECGVISIKSKPWFCGEMDNCCDLCRICYKKNINYKE